LKGQIVREDIAKVLLSEEQIQKRVRELGEELTRDYADCDGEVILICILKGAVMFFSDLARAMNMHMQMEFMGISATETNRRPPALCALRRTSTLRLPINM